MEKNILNLKKEFKAKGIYYTPKELALKCKKYLEAEGTTINEVYDPTCGQGNLLNIFDDDVMKYGQELDETELNKAKETLKNFIGYAGDTLKTNKFNKKFDYIIANPPFSISWEPNKNDKRFNIAPKLAPKSKSDYAFILHILYMLSEKGRATIIEAPGILYRGNSEHEIRKWLIEQNYIEAVILPKTKSFVDTKIQTIILILNKKKTIDEIIFIDENINKKKAVTLEDIIKNDYNLSVNLYIERKIRKEIVDPQKLQNEIMENLKKDILVTLNQSNLVHHIDNDLNIDLYIQSLNEIMNILKETLKKVKEQYK